MFEFIKTKIKFANPLPTHNGTELEVNNWILSDFVLKKLVPKAGVHPFPLNELMFMTSAVCSLKPKMIFEWGTNIGKSAWIFNEIVETFDIDCTIHSTDLPDDMEHNEHPHSKRGIMVKNCSRVQLYQGDGVDTSLKIIDQKQPKGTILFFVDGDHSLESVQRELEKILENVPNAAILLHDTFYQSSQSNYNIGPYKAISKSMESNGKKILTTTFGLPGMTLLY
jgi:cephalosporin hydroxylase